MKLANFASLDSVHQARGVKGLAKAAKADQQVFYEFEQDWETLALESEGALERLGIRLPASGETSINYLPVRSGPTETERAVKVRRVQSLFRATVLASYNYSCAISGIAVPELLVASHIVPWANEEARRLDPRNGISLSAIHDRAFDRGLIGLDDEFRILVSRRLKVENPTGLHRAALLSIEGKALNMPSRFRPDEIAVAWHREHVFAA